MYHYLEPKSLCFLNLVLLPKIPTFESWSAVLWIDSVPSALGLPGSEFVVATEQLSTFRITLPADNELLPGGQASSTTVSNL
eukprot:3212511-Rhodomonas_salina.1